jgi:hypothetical protein
MPPELIHRIGPTQDESHAETFADVRFQCAPDVDKRIAANISWIGNNGQTIADANQVPILLLLQPIFFFCGGGTATPCASPPPRPSIFSDYSFWSTTLLTRTTGTSLHMQWPILEPILRP